jgi:hypothetical protein
MTTNDLVKKPSPDLDPTIGSGRPVAFKPSGRTLQHVYKMISTLATCGIVLRRDRHHTHIDTY